MLIIKSGQAAVRFLAVFVCVCVYVCFVVVFRFKIESVFSKVKDILISRSGSRFSGRADIVIKFGTDMDGAQRITPNDCGDPLTFPPVPSGC